MQDEQYRPQDVDKYPLHMVVAIVPTTTDALVAALQGAGVAPDRIDLAHGAADAQRIVDATEGGLFGRMTRWAAPSEEHSQRAQYVQALRDGHAVVRVALGDESQKGQVAQVLAAYGGQFINYYGRWTVETLLP